MPADSTSNNDAFRKTALPAWVNANLDRGFYAGMHDGSITSYEPDVAFMHRTGESVVFCHHCEDFILQSGITPICKPQ